MIAFLLFDQLWQVARSIRSSRALFCCCRSSPGAPSGCPLLVTVARSSLGGDCSPRRCICCRVPSLWAVVVGCAAAYARPYGLGLDASAGVPLGKRCTLSALDPLPVGLVLPVLRIVQGV